MFDVDQESLVPTTKELRKRKREIVVIFLVAFLIIFLTWFEVRLFNTSQQLPFEHSIFFFGLVNFNIILLLFLLFLIFRNVVKVFVEKRSSVFGSSLKSKLVASFVAFSFIPTVLMFIISVFYINSSFDKWFSVKMVGVLKSSLEVTNAYYFNAKKRNYHFAHQVASHLDKNNLTQIKSTLDYYRKLFSLDSVEYYPALFGKRTISISAEENLPEIPTASLEFLQKGIRSKVEASQIHQFGQGNLVRVIVPVDEDNNKGAIIVSSFVPLSLLNKMNDVSTAYDEFRDINPLQLPLKSIYTSILVLMTLVILFAATWIGFYLAKQLSVPLVLIGRATKRVAEGDYNPLDIQTGSEEMTRLVESFNLMTSDLDKGQREITEYSKYIEVVLGNISTGVISVDNRGKITTINRHASQLLKLDANDFVGKPVRDLLGTDHFRTFAEIVKTMQQHKVSSLTREFKVTIQGEVSHIQMTISILKDDSGLELGKVIVFDDMTMVLNAQRAQAWSEVAKRIAHEIKNPLTPIKLSAERLQRKFSAQIQDPAFSECTTMIVRQVDDLKNLVNEFSQFARLPQGKQVQASLNVVIRDSLVLYKNSHTNVEFVFKASENLPEFKFDPGQMRRVLVNLIDNAIGATEKVPSPKVSIETKYDADLKIVSLTISDNGVGIPQQDRGRIFEPYFSTKETGTGLGLPIVKRIIEDHSGFIRALPGDEQGTKMLIEIPMQENQEFKT